MNENLDLTKILEGYPEGTKLYSTVYGEVSFEGIDAINTIDEYPIKLKAYNKYTGSLDNFYYTKDGRSSYAYKGECTLFPSKDQRDWSKFIRFWDKPKVEVEKFDPKTFRTFDKVLCRDNKNHSWRIDFFSHWVDYSQRPVCGYFTWEQSIPYNEETKHLIGTNEDCPEYYKWWEE